MVQLSISDVRRALWQTQPARTSAAEPSSAQLGQIFHEVFAQLMGDDKQLQWQTALDQDTVGSSQVLLDHVYSHLLGPRLTQLQASLGGSGEQLLTLWEATGEMSDWVASMLADAVKSGRMGFDARRQRWTGTEQLCMPEQMLSWELREPGWTGAVRVSGIADALWRNPQTGRWCVVEYKLGKGAPALDLAQVCLYHEMMAASGMLDEAGAVALVSFRPKREELFFPSARLEGAKAELRRLIGRMAGVLPDERAAGVSGSSVETPESSTPETTEAAKRLLSTFSQYGVRVSLVGSPVVGPSFMRFTVMPAKGVKVSEITRRQDELQIHMRLDIAPLIHTDGGRLVIDVKRERPEPVLFSEIASMLPAMDLEHGSAQVPIGVDLVGRLHFADLSQNACSHILVAGTPGSGKSEWLRTAIAGLLKTNTAETLKLVLIDPKMSAFTDLQDSRFLYEGMGILQAGGGAVSDALEGLIEEMERRVQLFREHRADDLYRYVAKTGQVLPRIVCACDEYFDLIAQKGDRKQIEPQIARLVQKGRSSGIHLIIATQYPKSDVVTSVIKASLSGRVCLRVVDATQSRVVLDQAGAERLLGKGDLFFRDVGEPVRLQAAYLTEDERRRIFGGG